jgi:anti-sigma factor RsiW
MTFDRDRHTPFEELISASLHGDLTADERNRLDAHLDSCASCRATLAAFSDQRRIMSGLRHMPIPRDLGARVRAGIEQEASTRPWWKRPPAIFAGVGGGLAVVAGALLALVLLNDNPDDRNVGQATPSPVESTTAATPIPTLPTLETPTPSEPAASVAPSMSIEPAPTATPVQASPEPDSYLAVTGPPDNQAMTFRDATTGDTLREVGAPLGVPIAAELSPDGQWIAYIVEVGTGSGLTEVRATRIAEATASDDPDADPPIDSPVPLGDTVTLAESVGGSPFVEHLFWSPDARFVAFTVIDRDGAGTDAWLFDVTAAETSQLTNVGNAYAGSWVPASDVAPPLLWLSTAGEEPRSYLRSFHEVDQGEIAAVDPADGPYPAATNVFQPLVSPDGAFAIFWSGEMARSGDEYGFVSGGAPWLAENRPDGEQGYDFGENQRLFSDLTIDQDAFTWAAIRWSLNSNAFVVWDTDWTGISQGSQGEYPDQRRVYLGRAFEPSHVTEDKALDVDALPEGASVVDVKVAGTGRHLAVTTRHPVAGQDLPQADLLLITRNFDNVADAVVDLRPDSEGWFGPAVYSAAEWAALIGD